ncbi:hypothetical protein AMTRI_Chr07g26700 [Amborella trichopoda]|uniref:Uncharacterized protein n=1 Tax=Amborella trichopoda TaxID=13333 RepID=W1P0Q6_AMBTC|nr:cyclin-dependent kinase 4 inhibitor C [Amborella trichopoda]ERN00535.1 hypothetical protein AMTR_s00102p00078160 [Amborella trichopoda]|eukprot:XP_006837966.1 cyclin-dependent kinase 4 inhibitor C [Amborella trichopoda]
MAVPIRMNGMQEEEEEEEEDEVALSNEHHHLTDDRRALCKAAELGDVDQLRHALDNLNGSIDDPVEDGDTALHLTCLYGFLPCVQLLLERGANLEAKDEEGAIPLHDACAGGFTEIVQLLINTARDSEVVKRILNTTDEDGDTPLHHAARGEHLEVVQLLVREGASLTAANVYGKVPAELSEPETEVRCFLAAAAAACALNSH